MQPRKLSQIMYLSWEIQRTKKLSRNRALSYAWGIYLAEDVAVYRLHKKHNNRASVASSADTTGLTLFA